MAITQRGILTLAGFGVLAMAGCAPEPGYYGGATRYDSPIYSGAGRGYERPYYVEPSYDRRGSYYRPEQRRDDRRDERRESRPAPREERRAAPPQRAPSPGITAPFVQRSSQDPGQRPQPADREGGR